MRAIKKARKFIETDPTSDVSVALSKLILALENEQDFALKPMYDLGMDDFNLLIEVMKDWRLDRFYEGKTKAICISLQANSIKS
jgi:hypothetical protein